MEDLNQDAQIQPAKAEAELRKLNLEVSALQWQNSWLGRLAQFATLGAVLVGVITVFGGLYQYYGDRQKERDLRFKELRERADNQYRADITQLLKYPTDEGQTKASAVFVLNDLANVVETGFQGDERSRKQSELGVLVHSIMQPPQFVATKTRNVDFDRAALECEYYKEFLRENRRANLFVLSRYKEAMASLRKGNHDLEQVQVFANSDWGSGTIPIKKYEKLKPVLPQFLELVYAFRDRVQLLKESVPDKSEGADEIKKDVDRALCYLHGNTNNVSVTRYVFGISDDEVRNRYNKCEFY